MTETNTNNNWANPTPAGLVALSVAAFVFFAMLSGLVDSSCRIYAGVWLLGGFVVQIFVGLIDLKHKNKAGGNTFLYFSAFFMLVSGILQILKWYTETNALAANPMVDGFAWIALTATIILWTPAFFKSNALLALIVLCLDFSLVFITFMDLGIMPAQMSMFPAVGMLAAGCMAVYLAAGMVVNHTYGKKIYPLPGPFVK